MRNITGGLTIFHPVKGQWIAKCGTLFNERMIPVRIACDEQEMEDIANLTMKYYDQLAVMYYRVSDDVRIIHA